MIRESRVVPSRLRHMKTAKGWVTHAVADMRLGEVACPASGVDRGRPASSKEKILGSNAKRLYGREA
jgi:predicted TIM-barrel fold metal-dependent hydrolase